MSGRPKQRRPAGRREDQQHRDERGPLSDARRTHDEGGPSSRRPSPRRQTEGRDERAGGPAPQRGSRDDGFARPERQPDRAPGSAAGRRPGQDLRQGGQGPGTQRPSGAQRPGSDEHAGRHEALRLEAHVAAGLEAMASEELTRRLGKRVKLLPQTRPEILDFYYHGEARELLALRTILEISVVRHFDVPRPRGLLGDQHFRTLVETIALVRGLLPADAYTTLHISAAGSESSVLTRLKQDLSLRTGLAIGVDEGDLLVRLRRPLDGRQGWEALVRISPRPLATRPWRVCNMEGALNATVAHAMVLLTRPRSTDTFLNLACGSGTLLLERLSAAPTRRVIGCDISEEALRCAAANVEAAGTRAPVELHPWDATALPLAAQSVDALVADLPFGHLVGTHAQNLELYPALLREAARVAAPGARFVVISQEVRLMESLLDQNPAWDVEQIIRVTLGGLHPRIFVLTRA